MTAKKARYLEYLKSPHWSALRKAAFTKAGWRCEFCANQQNLTGHHLRYRNLYNCTVDDIMVLCRPCHDKWHEHHGCRTIHDRTIVFVCLTDPAECKRRMNRAKKERRKQRKLAKRLKKLGTV